MTDSKNSTSSFKRKLDIVVLSDIHLGTYGCHAEELYNYLSSIQPEVLVLNGDIIDILQFRKSYWPPSHMKVLRQLLKMASQGVVIYYLTGNHDDTLRRFTDLKLGSFHLRDKLVLESKGKRIWIFHGDVMDPVILQARWLAKLGGRGYDTIIWANRFVNKCLSRVGKKSLSLSKKIKEGVKKAKDHVSNFEDNIAELALDHGYDAVICGHIHKAEIKQIESKSHKASVLYMNSGDWVESLTALECLDGAWLIYQHPEEEFKKPSTKESSHEPQDSHC